MNSISKIMLDVVYEPWETVMQENTAALAGDDPIVFIVIGVALAVAVLATVVLVSINRKIK